MSIVFNISQNEKKLKGLFGNRPTRPSVSPVPSVTTRAGALVVRFEHWTPKGDCKVTGNKVNWTPGYTTYLPSGDKC